MEEQGTQEPQAQEQPKPKGGRKPTRKAVVQRPTPKGEQKGAWKTDPKKIAETKRAWPIGSLVKYIGGRVEGHENKQGTIVGYRDANGLLIDFGRFGRGTISVPRAEMVRRGTGKTEKGTKTETETKAG